MCLLVTLYVNQLWFIYKLKMPFSSLSSSPLFSSSHTPMRKVETFRHTGAFSARHYSDWYKMGLNMSLTTLLRVTSDLPGQWVRLPAMPLSCNEWANCSHTHASVNTQYNLILGKWLSYSLALAKVTKAYHPQGQHWLPLSYAEVKCHFTAEIVR